MNDDCFRAVGKAEQLVNNNVQPLAQDAPFECLDVDGDVRQLGHESESPLTTIRKTSKKQ